ncbi:MFS transporter [Leucobacter luti]|uniref:MFS transporter n=1 Tax=Leucobacter luti TaxID=340320 RepID=UPI00215D77C0|nr:MFS transporter [Leucobacter luti]
MNTTTPRAIDPRHPLSLRNGSATFVIALASLMMANLAPFIMTALAHLGFDVITSGNILTWGLLASAVVGLGTSRLAAGAARRTLACAGLAVAVVAFGAAALIPNPTLAVTGLIVGGAGVGAAISTSGAAIAALRNPNRVSATSGLVNRVLITLVLAVIPLIGITQGTVFGALALISLAGLTLARWLPDSPEHAEPVDVTTSLAIAEPRRITVAGFAILLVFPLWGTSEDAIWTMAPVLGDAVGLDEQGLGFALSLAAAGGILGMLLVSICGARIGRAAPLAIALTTGVRSRSGSALPKIRRCSPRSSSASTRSMLSRSLCSSRRRRGLMPAAGGLAPCSARTSWAPASRRSSAAHSLSSSESPRSR